MVRIEPDAGVFFFFKQKTAYEMRISDWSSDVCSSDLLESLLCKELRYVGSKYPVCSVIRLRKLIRRGWVINAGQILKMMMQVSELDLTNPAVLQDQLTGVDSAYFIELMS